MNAKLMTEHHLECLSLKGGSTGLSESTLVKIPYSFIFLTTKYLHSQCLALDESNISSCLHFSMQNIEMSFDPDRASKQSYVNVSQ